MRIESSIVCGASSHDRESCEVEEAQTPAALPPAVHGPTLVDTVERSCWHSERMGSVVVRARGLVKVYGTGRAALRVLQGLDLDLCAGELVAVTGRSGCGKSTLLHLLGGLDRAEAGTVEVDGLELGAASERELARVRRDKIGFVFQAFHLLPELTGLENVLLPARLDGGREG